MHQRPEALLCVERPRQHGSVCAGGPFDDSILLGLIGRRRKREVVVKQAGDVRAACITRRTVRAIARTAIAWTACNCTGRDCAITGTGRRGRGRRSAGNGDARGRCGRC